MKNVEFLRRLANPQILQIMVQTKSHWLSIRLWVGQFSYNFIKSLIYYPLRRNIILIIIHMQLLKFFSAISLFLCLSLHTTAQSDTYQIDGVVEDTLGNPLIYATVLLLEEADSTLVEFTRTELDGSFRFKGVPRGNHIVKSSYVGYLPLTVPVNIGDQKKVNLGIMKMPEIASELMEVVIKAAKAPMKMRGDTIEYDASTFQVPEGSTVEDLLRRLPGIEVESDGSINADGKAVDRVTVDGKSFFGSDPKAATKNLPAEGISKVQVYDTKTEEEEITGAVGEAENKTMNLELKEDFKRGGFGKVVAGIGDEDRRELKGNYNKFNDKIQFSLVGVGNNTGRNGLSWDDYQDFLGSQAWNFGGGTDYGFGGGGRFFRFGGNTGTSNSIEQSIQSLFFSRGNTGFPENYSAGINFNYDHNKTKLSSVYYFNQANLRSESVIDEDKFFQAFTQSEARDNASRDKSQGHRVELSFEKELDSLHSIQVDFNGAFIDETTIDRGDINLSRDGELTSETTIDNNTNTSGNLLNGLFIFRKKFQKPGRSLGLNTSALITSLEDDWTQTSTTEFYGEGGSQVDSLFTDQQNNEIGDKTVLKANALYVEPIGNKFFFQTFLNHRNTSETGERVITDVVDSDLITNDFLSRTYDNSIVYNRLGSQFRYSNKGINVSVGGAYQNFDLQGDFSSYLTQEVLGRVDSQFDQIIPYASFNASINRNTYINASYTKSANEPAISDLQPIVDNLNPLDIREGNPDLVPEVSDSYSLGLRKNFPLHDTRLNVNLSYQQYDTQFSTEETVDQRLITTTRPINIEGGSSASARTFLNFPIKRNKVKVRVNYTFQINDRNALVNNELNSTQVISHAPGLKLDITPGKNTSIFLEGSINLSDTEYDLRPSQNQKTQRLTGSVEFNTKLFAGIFVSSTLAYERFTNDRFNLSTSIPIWNSSIYKYFMEGNKLELRLSIYDALNQNQGINQSAFGISVRQSSTTTLARYAMLSVAYNIRGVKSDSGGRRRGRFH